MKRRAPRPRPPDPRRAGPLRRAPDPRAAEAGDRGLSFFEERLLELQGRPRLPRPPPDPENAPMEQRLAGLLRRSGLRDFEQRAHVGPYEVDFLFRAQRLVVELDGFFHLARPVQERDRRKERDLARLGYRVLRITNDELRFAPHRALIRIRRELTGPPRPRADPRPDRRPRGPGG